MFVKTIILLCENISQMGEAANMYTSQLRIMEVSGCGVGNNPRLKFKGKSARKGFGVAEGSTSHSSVVGIRKHRKVK